MSEEKKEVKEDEFNVQNGLHFKGTQQSKSKTPVPHTLMASFRKHGSLNDLAVVNANKY